MKTKIVSVDFQKDFTAPGGKHYKSRPSVDFVKGVLVPYLAERLVRTDDVARARQVKIAEIVSDYRQPRWGDGGDSCHPGEWGFESEIPEAVKEKNIWIKCMNSPIWVRENIGVAGKEPGQPYQDTKKFDEWILQTIGVPEETEVVLVGLTIDCCVLCTAQEFCFRGYDVKILTEATDTSSGVEADKEAICRISVKNWADVIGWEEFKRIVL